MEKYIVRFDRNYFDACYYEVEAESEEDAISDFMDKIGDGRAKFLFDEVGDLPSGKPEIERCHLKLLKKRAGESYCCLDCSTGLYHGLDCDGEPGDGEKKSEENA